MKSGEGVVFKGYGPSWGHQTWNLSESYVDDKFIDCDLAALLSSIIFARSSNDSGVIPCLNPKIREAQFHKTTLINIQ